MTQPRAVIENGIVVNMILAAETDAGSVPIPTDLSVGIGWEFDGQTFTPSTAPPVTVYRAYTYSGFIDALTRPEALAVLTGAKTDPLLEMFMEIARARNGIDFNDDATRESAPYLVTSGVLTAQRLAELIG